MITAKRAFDSPPLARVAPGTLPALEWLVTVCLAKDPDDRWSSAHDVRLHLQGIAEAPQAAGRSRIRRAATRAPGVRRRRGGTAFAPGYILFRRDNALVVQPFPPTGAKWQVSKGGGQQPQWRRDGCELFYIGADKKLVGVHAPLLSL